MRHASERMSRKRAARGNKPRQFATEEPGHARQMVVTRAHGGPCRITSMRAEVRTGGSLNEATPTHRLEAGSIIGKSYRVLRPLAEGGMGAVYEVEQLTTGAHRALKVM